VDKRMANLHKLPAISRNPRDQSIFGDQLQLPLDNTNFAGNLVFSFEQDIQPTTFSNLILLEGVSCVADLRHVPFFSGDGNRHRKINKILANRNIPVFHVGSAYFSTVDKNLPESPTRNSIRHNNTLRGGG